MTSLIHGQLSAESGKKVLVYARESKGKKNGGGEIFNFCNFNPSNFSKFNFLANNDGTDNNPDSSIFVFGSNQNTSSHNNDLSNITEEQWNEMSQEDKNTIVLSILNNSTKNKKKEINEVNSAIRFQLHEIQKVVKTYNFNVAMVESDIGSGWSKKSIKQLAGLNRIKSSLEKYKNNAIVIVTSVSRISRNYEEISSEFLKECKQNGIRVYALRDNLIYDYKDKSNLSADFIKACIEAQKNSTELSMKMKEYHSQQKEKGSIVGQVEYGYKRKRETDGSWKKIENDEEMQIINNICLAWNSLFNLFKTIYCFDCATNTEIYASGKYSIIYNSMCDLMVNALNSNNITKRESHWTVNSIKTIVKKRMGEDYYYLPDEDKLKKELNKSHLNHFTSLMKNLEISIGNKRTKKKNNSKSPMY